MTAHLVKNDNVIGVLEANMFLRRYRKRIAEQVDEKLRYMGTCLNERDRILAIISPKDYPLHGTSIHCNTDCTNTHCHSYRFDRPKHSEFYVGPLDEYVQRYATPKQLAGYAARKQ